VGGPAAHAGNAINQLTRNPRAHIERGDDDSDPPANQKAGLNVQPNPQRQRHGNNDRDIPALNEGIGLGIGDASVAPEQPVEVLAGYGLEAKGARGLE